MSELFKIILTSSLTVFSGISVFVAGQIIVKFLIEPFYDYRRLVGEIADSLILYANVGPGLHDLYLSQLEEAEEKVENPRRGIIEERLKEIIKNDYKRIDESKQILRQQASRLMGTTNAIPMYSLWSVFRIVPSRKDIIKASTDLIGLSNSTGKEGTGRREKDIAKRLRIKILSERFGE